MRKLALVKAFQMEQENEHVRAYRQMFPGVKPNIFQMDLIEGTIDDAKAWRKTLEYWAGNDYRPQSVFKMLDYYKQVKEGTTFEKKVDRVGTAQPEPPKHDCSTCADLGEIQDKWISPNQVTWKPCPNCGERSSGSQTSARR